MEERHRARDKEKRLCVRLPRLEESPKAYAEVELFLYGGGRTRGATG